MEKLEGLLNTLFKSQMNEAQSSNGDWSINNTFWEHSRVAHAEQKPEGS